mmetsp:Transcript_15331/g.33824  ORF Transcript_15331/g.33824 Transcript_15331/m.33824 type:complete len:205 (-) Transcript_15331:70-684(-)
MTNACSAISCTTMLPSPQTTASLWARYDFKKRPQLPSATCHFNTDNTARSIFTTDSPCPGRSLSALGVKLSSNLVPMSRQAAPSCSGAGSSTHRAAQRSARVTARLTVCTDISVAQAPVAAVVATASLYPSEMGAIIKSITCFANTTLFNFLKHARNRTSSAASDCRSSCRSTLISVGTVHRVGTCPVTRPAPRAGGSFSCALS